MVTYIIMLLCVLIVLYNNLFHDVYQCYYNIDIEIIHWLVVQVKTGFIFLRILFCKSANVDQRVKRGVIYKKKTMLYQFPDIFSLIPDFRASYTNKISITYTL